MERESFIFYRSFYNSLRNLSVEDRDKLSMAILGYALDGIEPELDGYLLSMFDLIRPQIDANNKRYSDGCKGGQYGFLGGRPPKTWDNSQKPHPNPTETPQEPQANPSETPNDNDNDNDNVNDNEKGCGGKQIALDADASRGKIKDAVGEKNKSMTLNEKLKNFGLEDEIIELAIVYNGCKKGKKLDKFKDAQLKIRVDKLRKCGFGSIDGMKQVLENSIAGGYEGIFELKTKPIPRSTPISGGVIKVGNSNIFL